MSHLKIALFTGSATALAWGFVWSLTPLILGGFLGALVWLALHELVVRDSVRSASERLADRAFEGEFAWPDDESRTA